MRILHVIESLEFGGAEKIVISLANSMVGTHEIAICCLKKIGALGPDLDRHINVFCLDKGEGNDYLLPLRLARLVRKGAYDLVHTHNWGAFLEGGFAGVMARTPVLIHTVHGPYADYPETRGARVKISLRHFLERLVSRFFYRIAAVSDAIGQYIVRDIRIDPRKVVTVHNGIPADNGHPPAKARTGDVVFIAVGRLAEIKNHRLMLGAFRQVLVSGAPARLLIVGDGPERANIERYLEANRLEDKVRLLGFRSDVGDLLREADVFILTSRYEGISIAMLEAMGAGLPVIATRVGGVPETVRDGKTGLLVGPDDLPGLAQAMRQLAESEESRREMGRRGRDFLIEEFSLAAMTERYRALYAGTAGQGPKSS
jgi:sugar transferase (PEP-CTERM/EpsH1 system associated)